MTMIMDGRSFKLPYAFFTLFVLVHLRLALGKLIPGVGDANNISCPEDERQALLEFKKGISDPLGWLSSWGSEEEKKNCCNWQGIQCSNQTGHVIQLQLGISNLTGMISPSILELPYLTYLDLSFNDFNHSHIPDFIGSLSNLEHLNLSRSNLSGPIPHQLGNLSRLRYLHLGLNNLTKSENLEWLSHMSSIEDLDLSFTNLSVANDWLEVVSSLPNLKTLDMSACNLPLMSLSSFSQFNHSKSFTSLESLQLRDNEINDIPKFFGDICTLRELGLSGNNLNGQLIEHINDLFGCAKDSLEVLELARNQLWGSLPDFAMFPSLKEIQLWSNKLNGTMPKTIGNLHNLEHLDVSLNYLQDVISEAHFSNLSELLSLDLSGNSLTLEFDFNWVPPFQLDELHLRSCKLGPRFPNWIRTQRNVTILDISNAQISDTVPAEWFANLPPKLYRLNISSNQIHGQLPNVSKMSSSELKFDLSANRLEGPLPLFSTNVSSLNLSRNRFSGPLSPLCKVNNGGLGFLDLSDNLLSGQLPNCFMNWPNLLILNLANNNFFGEVPSSFGFLSMLHTLSLHDNTFSGDFPNSLKNCSNLRFMDLGNNRFSEKIPAWIAEDLPQLIVLILRSNKFSGSIPRDTCKLKYLRILDLSLNDISGTIPQCLNNFTAMAHKADSSTNLFEGGYYDSYGNSNGDYVDSAMVAWKGREYKFGKNLGLLKIINLSSNKLTGKLPTEITSLLELVVLNVSKNNLIGEIPQTIGQLKLLESFDMSWNQFSGEIPSSMSKLQFLSHLNLSFNNLSGKIPSGTQLQGFDATCFTGNRALCGPPLTQKCPGEETPNQCLPTDNGSIEDDKDNRDEFEKWFYVGAGIGFAVGFWGICSSLILKRSWRHAYFLLLDNMKDWLYVTMEVNKARFWRMFQRQG
ncbi:receptor-like protein EIX1 isoform X4 [Quercus robur]|uniref:receptor-like protein EIX1 isoform X4 n=1 Tax=Quercus robur TaxID=38942 RepID=UPI002163AE22|nr:receptor-like protein EIX1 isoform X4 [Quercus robur]